MLGSTFAYLVIRRFDTSSITEYTCIVVTLIIALGLAIVSSSEGFEDGGNPSMNDHTTTELNPNDSSAALASIASAFDRIASIPGAAKKFIIDGVDSMAAALRPKEDDASKNDKNVNPKNDDDDDSKDTSEDKENVDMNESLYEKDRSLWGKNGKVDPEKYKKMTTQYANIHYMMCNLKAVDMATHDKIMAILVPSAVIEKKQDSKNSNKSNKSNKSNNSNNDTNDTNSNNDTNDTSNKVIKKRGQQNIDQEPDDT